jgi:hypothetical protein
MRHQLPPDRDPVLRAAIGLDKAAQLTQLWSMFGEPSRPVTQCPDDHGTFTHYGAQIGTTPTGGLSYCPVLFEPPEVDGDATTITAVVEHERLKRRKTPRAPKEVAKLQRHIDQWLPFRGTHVFSITHPPATWGDDHLLWLGRRLAGFLPPAEHPLEPVVMKICTWGRAIEVEVYRERERASAWSVSCHLSKRDLLDTVVEFARADRDPGYFESPIGADAIVAPAAEPLPLLRVAAEDEDDDDLDAIEKAARRRLHGDKTIPPTSQSPTPATKDWPDARDLHAVNWKKAADLGPIEIGRLLTPIYIGLLEMVRVNPQAAKESLRILMRTIEAFTAPPRGEP